MKITPKKFEEKLWEIINTSYGLEERHINADALMCKILKQHGYRAGVKVFLEMDKWHA